MTKAMLSRVPEDLHARVKNDANERGISMSKVVTEALEMYFRSVSLAAYMEKNSGQVTVTINHKEVGKLRDFIEEDDGRTAKIQNS